MVKFASPSRQMFFQGSVRTITIAVVLVFIVSIITVQVLNETTSKRIVRLGYGQLLKISDVFNITDYQEEMPDIEESDESDLGSEHSFKQGGEMEQLQEAEEIEEPIETSEPTTEPDRVDLTPSIDTRPLFANLPTIFTLLLHPATFNSTAMANPTLFSTIVNMTNP